MKPTQKQRFGIAGGGNWIVDRVKIIDRLPDRGMLATIRSETRGTGGAPANVLMDLARLQAPFPLSGIGIVGADADGAYIQERCGHYNIDASGLRVTREAPTSYTDVMSEAGTNARTFFHCRGTNALFGPEHVDIPALTCRIFHLGYLLLLDHLDAPHSQSGTVAAALLKAIQAAGIKTSLDVVSEDSDRFKHIVPPALKYVNYLILNEIETGRIVDIQVRRPDRSLDGPALIAAVDKLATFGAMELIAVHMPEGVYLRDRQGRRFAQGSLDVPKDYIRSSLGAGDAFCAGMLYGLHEGWDCDAAAHLGTCTATACLADSTATDGVGPRTQVLELARRYREYEPPVKI
jgi:sugar/nucleoside kinase (ribokinase family)